MEVLETLTIYISHSLLIIFFPPVNPLLSPAQLNRLAEECLVWQDDENMRLVNEAKTSRVPPGMALTVETTAYALLTALAQDDLITAHAAACFLSSQENYEGGFKSTQVGLMRLSGYFLEYLLYVFYSNSKKIF